MKNLVVYSNHDTSQVKDLKRQLQAERRKAEKLQERLQEWAEAESNSEHNTPVSTGHLDPDRSSISSWSLMSGQGGDQGPTSSSSPLPSSTPSPPGEVANGSNTRMVVEKENGTLEKDNQVVCRVIYQDYIFLCRPWWTGWRCCSRRSGPWRRSWSCWSNPGRPWPMSWLSSQSW